MTVRLLIELIYLITAVIYGVFALRIVHEGRKDTSNRLLCIIFGLMSFWSVCLMGAYAADDYNVALAWRRSAGLGWGTVFSFLLHFVIIVSGYDKWLRGKVMYPLLYGPALLNLFVFLVYTPIANSQFHLELHSGVWVSHFVSSIWNRWHTVYFMAFSLLSILLIALWHRRTLLESEKRQSRLLFLSFTAAFLVSLLTDFVGARTPEDQIPFQAGIVAILIPVTAIYYIARRYSFLDRSDADAPTNSRQIMTDRHRNMLYRFFGWMFFVASYGHVFSSTVFVYPRTEPDSFVPTMLAFVSLLGSSFAIMLLKHSKMTVRKQELVMFLVILWFDLQLMLAFAYTASASVWASIFLLLILTVVFEDARLMLTACVVHVALQSIFALHYGEMVITVTTWQYMVRAGLVAAGMYLAYFVNRIYMTRLRENEQQSRFQRALADVAGSLATLNLAAPLQAVQVALASIGRYMDAAVVAYVRTSTGQVGTGYIWEGTVAREMTSDERQALVPMVRGRGELARRGPHVPQPDSRGTVDSAAQAFLTARGVSSIWLETLVRRGQDQHDLLLMHSGNGSRNDEQAQDFLRIASSSLANYFTRVNAEQELMYLTSLDPLTGLNRRDEFGRQAAARLASYDAENVTPALLFISLSGFKEINDRGGHTTGDAALQMVSQRLVDASEPDDILARFSGVDFLCLTTQENMDLTRKKAEAIIAALNEPMEIGEHCLYVNVSVGVAVYPWDGRAVDMLTNNAVFAVYAARRRGLNQVQFYSFEQRSQASYTLALRTGLREAVSEGQLFLMYQPQVDLKTRRITGLEALVRWRHPSLGVVPPGTFIPLAEEMGLLSEIDTWVLETACRQNRQWISQGLASAVISVNFSLTQFTDSDVPALVTRVLNETGLAPEYLEMEITEGVAGKPTPEIRDALRRLTGMGVSVAIDDFGTEYSNLSRLTDIPFHRIKLDMSLIRAYSPDNPRSGIIIENVLGMAKGLSVPVVAEGVETLEQATFLERTGCDTAQGYYFYRPLSAEDAEKALFMQTLGTARRAAAVL